MELVVPERYVFFFDLSSVVFGSCCCVHDGDVIVSGLVFGVFAEVLVD